MNVKFFIKNPKEGTNTIHLRMRIGRTLDFSLATKEKVFTEDWDERNQYLLEEYTEFKNGRHIQYDTD